MTFRKNIILGFLLFLTHFAYNQGIPIGNWRTHLPLNKVIAVAEAENIIYAATPYSIFYYDRSDHSVNLLNKVNGLSDVGISAIHYDKTYKILVIAYNNTNIDLIKNKKIINIPDIKKKSIPGNKKINNITSFGKYAYLSCGFGIVVVDITRNEIKDTYLIGDNGKRIDVLDLAVNDTSLYAATEEGIYKSNLNSPNLADFNNWKKDSSINDINAKYSQIAFFYDKIIVQKDKKTSNADTLFAFNGNNWVAFDTSVNFNFKVSNNLLICSHYGYLIALNNQLQAEAMVFSVDQKNFYPWQAIMDKDNNFWIADDNRGLIRLNRYSNESKIISPNSPSTKNAFVINAFSSGLYLAPGGFDNGVYSNSFIPASYHCFSNESWSNYDKTNISGFDSIIDIVEVIPHPSNNATLFAASWSNGVVELSNHKITNIYNENNSSLRPIYFGNNRFSLRTGGLAFDESGNLWVSNSGVQNRLSVKYSNGTWEAFDVTGIVNDDVSRIVIDRNNYVWMLVRGNRIAVFNKKSNSHQKAWININKGNDLSTNDINCFVQDLEGEIWIGTDKGIKVIYSPDNVFNTNGLYESAVTAQTILLEYGGYVQHLLEFESVTAIAVDGANRKWVGTQKAGVFLLSPDGTQQLAHFSTDNSPILSNTVFSIGINPENGEIFIGTDLGVISYRGSATKGGETFKDVYAYPNPVRPDYNGTIAIKGLVRDANVKITDISGNLVYNTIANGGQAVWNGKSFNGEKAQTGIYLVFCTNEDGEETMVTKIMFVN